MNRSTVFLDAAFVVVVGGWAVLASSGGDGSPEVVSSTGDTIDGVCDTLRAASQLDEDPERVFYNRAHEGLHGLAASATSIDREVAGDLLRAKQRAEVAFEEQLPREQVTAILRHLFTTAKDAGALVDPSIQGGCSA